MCLSHMTSKGPHFGLNSRQGEDCQKRIVVGVGDLLNLASDIINSVASIVLLSYLDR